MVARLVLFSTSHNWVEHEIRQRDEHQQIQLIKTTDDDDVDEDEDDDDDGVIKDMIWQ